MPYRWWKQFDDSDLEPKVTIEQEVPADILATLSKLPLFAKMYDETLPDTEFSKFQVTKDTLTQFLTARDDLIKIVRARMLAAL